ncbi:MAG: hypothetical protein Q9172_005720 [Xanthocarpia lactea]
MGPSREAMENFVAITGQLESTAAEWLQLYDNNSEKAINAFFDDPDLLDRKVALSILALTCKTFPVHHQDTLNPNVFSNDTAPSRPPSRVSTGRDGRYNHPGPYDRQFTLAEREDFEMQEAMARSTTLPQETGVIAADKPYFGPVTHEHQDTKNWQMTLSKATAREIPLDPEPQDRRRQPGTPAFLRPTAHGHRLPGLVKILHTIPAAREALLSRGCIRSEYGRESEWWNGVPVEYPQVVYEEEDLEAPYKEILYEAQRLMAFLDDTERTYGSSDALSALPRLREFHEDPIIDEFLGGWHYATVTYDPESQWKDVFSTLGVRSDGETERVIHDVQVLEVEVKEDQFVSGQSLYEIIDSTLWPSRDGTEVEGQVYLDTVADVLVMRVSRGDSVNEGLDNKIPPIWYADRYRKSAQPQVHKMFAAKTAAEDEIRQLDARKEKISQYNMFNKTGDGGILLQGAKQYFDKTVQYLKETEGGVQAESRPTISKAHVYSKIAEELEKISERVAKKLDQLEDSKEKAQARLRELSKLLTEPSDIPEESPRERYTLRGVCAEPHTVYVQERIKPETQDDLVQEDAEGWQWWKFNYESNRTDVISCMKVRQVEVLKAARDESPSAVLVYASDRAMSVENKELPRELTSFVQYDNSTFAAELASSTDHNGNSSTQYNSNIFRPPPRESLDRSPPSYDSHRVYPPPQIDRSYDDYIPVSLRRHSSMDGDDDNMEMDEGVEMTERDGGASARALASYGGQGVNYRLGAYEPEIEIEDEDEKVKTGRLEW